LKALILARLVILLCFVRLLFPTFAWCVALLHMAAFTGLSTSHIVILPGMCRFSMTFPT